MRKWLWEKSLKTHLWKQTQKGKNGECTDFRFVSLGDTRIARPNMLKKNLSKRACLEIEAEGKNWLIQGFQWRFYSEKGV
jgi:hypothetical protein